MEKHVLITGGTKGIGLAISHGFAAHGCHLITCGRSEKHLQIWKEQLQPYGVQTFGFQADLADQDQIDLLSQFVFATWEYVDVLINNTGIFLPGSILEEKEGQLESMMHTNLYSAYHLTRKIVPSMVKRRQGHVFNMCSIASKIAYPNGGSYSISKFALLGFSKVLREETKAYNIKVTSILPGATWSASWAGVDLPESRLMQADDIASLVLNAYQLSDSAVVEEILVRPQLGDL